MLEVERQVFGFGESPEQPALQRERESPETLQAKLLKLHPGFQFPLHQRLPILFFRPRQLCRVAQHLPNVGVVLALQQRQQPWRTRLRAKR